MSGKALGRGPYREATRPIRIPLSLVPDVLALLAHHRARLDSIDPPRVERLPTPVREGKPHGRLPQPVIFNQPP